MESQAGFESAPQTCPGERVVLLGNSGDYLEQAATKRPDMYVA